MKRVYLLIGFLLVALATCYAGTKMQPESDMTVHLLHAHGLVADIHGKPVGHAQVTLSRDDKVVFETTTDEAGRFRFDHADGQYTLHVKDTGDSSATREIVVGEAAMLLLQKNMLYVILGPGACADECSSVFTSKRDFDRELRKKSGHNN